jgi:hypothetical protein
LISALIFSIKLVSSFSTLRLELIARPSDKLLGGRLIEFESKAIKDAFGLEDDFPQGDVKTAPARVPRSLQRLTHAPWPSSF